MKVSETVIPKKQNGRGTGTCRKDLTVDSKGNCARRNGNDILKSQQTSELERTLKAKNVESERTAEKQSDMKQDPQANGNKKPWIPCARRPSKPKPLPTTLEMDLSSVDAKKVCKKYPKSPSSPDSIPATAEPIDKQKAKHSSTNTSMKQSNTTCRYMVPTISSSAASAAASLAEKRSKVILKRQYALDKATCNMRESYSEESLNSIHSVTQLLKIERSEYAFNKNDRGKILDEDEEKEETLTGVKLIAAKLEAKNLANKNNSFNRHGPSGVTARNNNRGDNESIQNKKSGDDSGSPSRLRSIQQPVQQNNLTHGDNKSETIKGCREEEKKKASTSTIIATGPSLTSQELRENSAETRNAAKSPTAKSSETSSSASSLLTAAVAVASAVAAETTMSRAERKIVSTKNLVASSDTGGRARPSTSGTQNNKIKLSSSSSASSNLSTEKKEQSTSTLGATTLGTNLSNPKSIRSRSSSPIKSLNNKSNESTTSKRKDTFSGKVTPEATSRTRSRSASASRQRSSATARGPQTKEVKERKQEVLSANNKDKSQSTSQPGISTTRPDKYAPRGRERQKRSIKQDNTRESQSLGRKRKDDSRVEQFEKNYSVAASTSVTSTTSKTKTAPRNSEQTGSYLNATTSSRTKSAARVIPKDDTESSSKNKETKAVPQDNKDRKCKSRVDKSGSNTNNSNRLKVTKPLSKKNSEESDLSLSSLSSGSSSSFCGTTWKSSPYVKQEQRELEKKDISIPTIVMSEYVEGESEENGKSAELFAHSQDLHIPLQFIEPLEPICDIVEGSSLELKVRIRGAETVIWVKEDKVIPNAPPDFQYFHEKSKDVYGLRIADVFVEDSGLYAVTFGARGSEITCWCEVDVLETGTNEDDDEDISWGDSDVSEEIKNQKPLVVPVIVTSQAEPDSDSSLSFDITKESLLTKTTVSEQTGKEKEKECEKMSSLENNSQSGSGSNSNDCENMVSANPPFRSSKNESAFLKLAKSSYSYEEDIEEEDEEDQEEEIVKSHSQNDVSSTNLNYATGGASAGHPVTEFTSKEAEVEPRFSRSSTQSKFVATSESSEMDHMPVDKSGMGSTLQEGSEKRKLVSELSSASDESIYMREATRSGDEGAHFSAEEMLTSISPLINARGVTNENEEDLMTASESPPQACSPCSEQNGRSSSVDSAIGFLGRPLFSDGKFPPRILVGPSNILALYGEIVHLRVKVQNYGIPKTAINWFKFVNGTYRKIEQSSGDQTPVDAHVCVTKCGSLSTLTVTHINYDDCGRYRVKVQNVLGMDSHDMILTVEGPPEPPSTPPKVKYDEKAKTILIQWSSCPYDGGAKITGYYVEASIVHGSKTALNKEDQDQWHLLTPQSYSWLCYTLTNPKRGGVYKFRVFGENVYGKGKPTDPSLPLLVPILMEGRRAGSSDALLWSLKSLSQEETVLRADPKRNKAVLEQANETTKMEESTSSQEEEPVEYRSVDIKRNSFYDVYDKLDELGKGRFGIVFEVVNKETKQSHAGKFVKCIKAKDKERVQLEVKIMNDLGYHPKLICLIDAFEMAREIIIVTQRIDGGELFERVVADDFTLTEGDCITFLRQISDAVKYIHDKNIMHLDLKPENILCTSKNSNQIKIIDFGLAQYHDPKEQLRVLFGTAEFVSPEIINYEPIAPSTDNWSVGVITYILLSGLSPFMGDNDNETFSNITRAEFDFEDEAFEKISDDAKDFISNLLVKRPEKRMTAEQCLNHRWLESEHKKDVILSTDKLKRFLVRRKWQKTGNAIRALGRITTLYSSRRSSSASTSSTPTGSMSSPTSHPFSPSRTGSLVTQDSLDNDNVFLTKSPSLPESHRENGNFSFTNINNANLNNNNINDSNTQSKRVQLCETKNQEHFIDKNESAFTTHRTKYTDPCTDRSDSGVCDVGSCSSSLNYE